MIKPSYLLTGPELGEKKAYIDSIRAEINKQYGDEIEEYTFYPYDSNLNDAIGVAESLSMFSSSSFDSVMSDLNLLATLTIIAAGLA